MEVEGGEGDCVESEMGCVGGEAVRAAYRGDLVTCGGNTLACRWSSLASRWSSLASRGNSVPYTEILAAYTANHVSGRGDQWGDTMSYVAGRVSYEGGLLSLEPV